MTGLGIPQPPNRLPLPIPNPAPMKPIVKYWVSTDDGERREYAADRIQVGADGSLTLKRGVRTVVTLADGQWSEYGPIYQG